MTLLWKNITLTRKIGRTWQASQQQSPLPQMLSTQVKVTKNLLPETARDAASSMFFRPLTHLWHKVISSQPLAIHKMFQIRKLSRFLSRGVENGHSRDTHKFQIPTQQRKEQISKPERSQNNNNNNNNNLQIELTRMWGGEHRNCSGSNRNTWSH